ncbi:MAG: TatD family hydrolase [Lachnospiraceae bacterium]
MRIFDSHAHYNDEAFAEDRTALFHKMKEEGIEYVVNVGADMESSKRTIALTQEYDSVYGAIGVHPDEVGELTEADMVWLKDKSQTAKVVAIGEIGLDYSREECDKDLQKKWFSRQLELAVEVNLPVIVHSRDAAEDTFEILKEMNHRHPITGIIHCYSYSKEMAKEYLKLGFYFGIGGVVTFKNAKKVKEAVQSIPIEKIVIETDCPYLAPTPYRGERNSSLYLPEIIKEIALLKDMSTEEVAEQTYHNAKSIFGMAS